MSNQLAKRRRPGVSLIVDENGRDIVSGSVTIGGDTRPYSYGGDSLMKWAISGLSYDADIYRKLPVARLKCRSLDNGDQPNEYVRKFFGEIENNVIGSAGVVLQMLIVETEDRVVSGRELAFLRERQTAENKRREGMRRRLAKYSRKAAARRFWRLYKPEPVKYVHERAQGATVLKGAPDIYACNLIETAWEQWKAPATCTVTKQVDFHTAERLCLRGAGRDGEAIVRMIKGFDNEFGFALQLIDPDWLDIRFNEKLPNGNQVVMGVEFNTWKEPVAFHIIVQDPDTWLWGTTYGYSSATGDVKRQRIDAAEIVHVFMRERVDQTRGVPWLMCVLNRLRMLGKYEEAELLAAMSAACKPGFYENTLDPSESGPPPGVELDEATGEFIEKLSPGGVYINKYGWRYVQTNPTHPNGNYGEYRKGVLRGVAAGLPGSTYYGLSQDLEAVNFSSMQGGDRESRETYMMLQNWFISGLHGRIFPIWLECALMSGKVALPMSRFKKYNLPSWHGRRWKAIDPVKDITAKILAINAGLMTRTQAIADMDGGDYEDRMLKLAYEAEFEEALGLTFTGPGQSAQGGAAGESGDGSSDGSASGSGSGSASASGSGSGSGDGKDDPVTKEAVAEIVRQTVDELFKKRRGAKALPSPGKKK
jgi:lambda family phage portal protein